ncbi:hypothetical protein HY357_02860 [Candidatus Roizmanbacteria bacterium]|nr:hypothetical protein [Candidatus Roizmanbacteria bacterium]
MQIIKKVIFSLLPLLILYFFKSRNEKRKHKPPLFIDKDKVEEGEILEEKK